MKKIITFLVIAAITGIIGFSGWRFDGVAFIRILFLLALDALVIVILARFLFSDNRLKLERVKRK
ncbi:DUF1328 domain-containing protein [Zunongwangia sp.]|uniref:DUF1328 domain-containing protein n=1 Tax=Zunongwangia sp. TaxID=1965325 RepID=UPI003AA7F65C